MIGAMDSRFAGYGFSLTGRSHLAANTVCQDSHIFSPCAGGRWQLAAVADGLGTAPRSDMGAKTALEALASRCAALPEDPDGETLLTAMREGFSEALTAVKKLAEATSGASGAPVPVSDFDCTLSACLYDGEKACIGHVGDSGIIGLTADGRSFLLTDVQKGDAWNVVTPLRLGVEEESCVFRMEERPFSALLLVTDGLLDQIAPPLLSAQPDPFYHRFLSLFISHTLDTDPEALTAVLQSDSCKAVTDDMTAAALWRAGASVSEPPAEYLADPDWEAIRLEQYRKLYPHLKKKEAVSCPN